MCVSVWTNGVCVCGLVTGGGGGVSVWTNGVCVCRLTVCVCVCVCISAH